jgi:hypothetical protein
MGRPNTTTSLQTRVRIILLVILEKETVGNSANVSGPPPDVTSDVLMLTKTQAMAAE